MNILFIGGSGNISSACTDEALRARHTVYHFNRGCSPGNEYEGKVIHIAGDINNTSDRQKISDYSPFDVVVNFVCFTPSQIREDIEFFYGKTRQYIFISSATVYKKPPDCYLITENCPLENPFWDYAQNKIACEHLLTSQNDFPYTIIRPSYTYGKTWIPVAFSAREYNPVYRIRNRLPLISHGDGESLWVMTHNTDFARALVPLFGKKEALRNHFHITSDEVHTWDQIYSIIGSVVGIEPRIIHIPSDFINALAPDWGAALLGDKARSMVFDNSKIKKLLPEWKANKTFEEGIKESVAWFEKSAERMQPDHSLEEKTNYIINTFQTR